MSKVNKDDGGQAFPQFSVDAWKRPGVHGGMSLRDWFAGQSLAGLLAAGNGCKDSVADSYTVADMMVQARSQSRDELATAAQHVALGIGGGN